MDPVSVTDHTFVPDDHGRCLYVQRPSGVYCNKSKDDHLLAVDKPRLLSPFVPAPKPVHATDTIPAVQAWDAFAAQVRDTIVRKSAGYGNAWQRQGYMGQVARVLSKMSRIESMTWNDTAIPEAVGESLTDTAVDLAALSAFLVANLEEGNKWGR